MLPVLLETRGVLLALIRGTPHVDAVEAIRRRAASLRGYGLLHVIAADGPPPDAAAREVYLKMIRERTGDLRATAVVGEGSPFLSAIVRSVVTGLVVAVRPKFPMKVFPKADGAIAWLVQVLDEARVPCASPTEIQALLGEARRLGS